MDSEFKSRRQVSYEQMNGLLEFLQKHQDLAKGLTRGRRGKMYSLKLWNLCAKKLNVCKDGAVKDGRGWSKYWCDWKYRVRRKALELKAAKDNNQPPPEGIVPLSHMEDCILGLIGEHAVEGVVIKRDPLADGDTDGEEEVEPDNNDSFNIDDNTAAVPQYELRKSSRSRKRRRSRDLSDVEEQEHQQRPGMSNGTGHSDYDEDAAEFLRLERQKLDNSIQMVESIRSVASQISGLRDVMIQIRDVLLNNRVNL